MSTTTQTTNPKQEYKPLEGKIYLFRMDKLIQAKMITVDQADKFEDMLFGDKEMEELATMQIKSLQEELRKTKAPKEVAVDKKAAPTKRAASKKKAS
jgi:hypothetical protein